MALSVRPIAALSLVIVLAIFSTIPDTLMTAYHETAIISPCQLVSNSVFLFVAETKVQIQNQVVSEQFVRGQLEYQREVLYEVTPGVLDSFKLQRSLKLKHRQKIFSSITRFEI